MKHRQCIFCSHPSALVLDCALYYLRYKSKSPKDVQHNITSVLQFFFCKDRRVRNLKLRGGTFSRGAAPMHNARRLHRPMFLCRAAQPAREKHRSQLLRMQSIESNLLTSSIACASEQGGHLWRETKWLACKQSAWWRHQILWREHKAGRCKPAYANCEGMTKVLWWGAVAVELRGANERTRLKLSMSSANCFFFKAERRQTGLGAPHVPQIYLTFSRYCVTGDLSQKEVIRLFSFVFFFVTFGFGWHFLISVR